MEIKAWFSWNIVVNILSETHRLYHYLSHGSSIEIAYSFASSSFFMASFWLLPMSAKVFTPWWCLLHDRIGFCSLNMLDLDDDVLVVLGAAYSTLWEYHWECVIDTEPWIASSILNMVRQDHGLLFSSLFPSADDAQGNILTLPLIDT